MKLPASHDGAHYVQDMQHEEQKDCRTQRPLEQRMLRPISERLEILLFESVELGIDRRERALVRAEKKSAACLRGDRLECRHVDLVLAACRRIANGNGVYRNAPRYRDLGRFFRGHAARGVVAVGDEYQQLVPRVLFVEELDAKP